LSAVLDALKSHPEANAAVLKALTELDVRAA
jgi:hypothetical protein